MPFERAALERLERLDTLSALRGALRRAFGLELVLVTEEGPMAHRTGGVMTGSSEVCRSALFSREGFARCDAHYRALATHGGAVVTEPCHLGLASIAVRVPTDAAPPLFVVASGFSATAMPACPPADLGRVSERLSALDPSLGDAGDLARRLPVVRGDRAATVQAILAQAAEELAAAIDAEARARRSIGGTETAVFGIVGASPKMRETFDLVRRVVASEAPVLVVGESGTGKELVARAIHTHGPRKAGPFVAQSCATLSDDVLEASLFGHVRGAFSGAIRGHEGLFGAAAGGTLFLDEVAEMSPAMQAKLLRVLSDGTYLPVGSASPRKADVRLVTATHHDPAALVAEGRLRQDLYYRLHVIAIPVPPLRERPGDVRLLAEHFLRETSGAPARVSPSAWSCLERYAWPGNVRELRAEIARWTVVCGPGLEVGPEHLSAPIRAAGGFAASRHDALPGEGAGASAAAGTGSLEAAVAELERAVLARGLERTGGNRTRLAKELEISRTTLNERLKRYGLG